MIWKESTRIRTEQPLLAFPSYVELEVFYELETSIIGRLEVLASAGLLLEEKRLQGGEVSSQSSM